jgi:hypothetical protein
MVSWPIAPDCPAEPVWWGARYAQRLMATRYRGTESWGLVAALHFQRGVNRLSNRLVC